MKNISTRGVLTLLEKNKYYSHLILLSKVSANFDLHWIEMKSRRRRCP
jgi:hypothetical protein